jgi:hypothetical protein
MRRVLLMTVLGLPLLACSAQHEVYRTPTDAGPPPTRDLIRSNLGKIFASGGDPQQLRMTEPRSAMEFDLKGWRVCLAASVKIDMGGQASRVPVTLALFIQNNQIVDRRRTKPEDECGTFSPL